MLFFFKQQAPLTTRGAAQKLYVPTGANRYYYVYGRPIETTPDMAEDRERAAAVYAEVKRAVEDCITYLLEQRDADPYADLLRRGLYERARSEQAPTFSPPSHIKL